MQKLASKKTRRATIRDVAHHAGVSIATVSRVINGSANVDSKTYERTMAAVKKHNYYPRTVTDVSGKHVFRLKKGLHTGNIGVAFYETTLRWRGSHLFGSYIRGVEKACSDRGYHPIVEVFSGVSKPEPPRCLVEGKVDGLILKASQCDYTFVRNLAKVCPIVMMDTYRPALPVTQVMCDDHGATALLTDYLIGLGHQRIAFVNVQPRHGRFLSRSEGYSHVMKLRNLYDPSLLVEVAIFDLGFDDDRDPIPSMAPAVDALLKCEPAPTAVIFVNDWSAGESYRHFGERGLRVGKDISVVGFDNNVPLCEVLDPPLTSFAIPNEQIAEAATAVLIEQLENGQGHSDGLIRTHMLTGEIRERASVFKI